MDSATAVCKCRHHRNQPVTGRCAAAAWFQWFDV